MSANPLSFFELGESNDNDSDSSDSDIEKEINETSQEEKCLEKTFGVLPPPLKVLANAQTPEFVTSHIRTDMDWDKMVKAAPNVPPKECKPWENILPAVESKSNVKSHKPDIALVKEVPQTLAPSAPKLEEKKGRPADVKDHAIMWSKMYKDDVRFTGSNMKRPRPEDEDEELAGFCHTDLNAGKVAFQAKHLKTRVTPHAYKEKHKRDVGQANRDKMFVEEEKRILRQNFDSS